MVGTPDCLEEGPVCAKALSLQECCQEKEEKQRLGPAEGQKLCQTGPCRGLIPAVGCVASP